MVSSIHISIYRDSFLSIQCATINGRRIIAKPLLLYSLIILIDKKYVNDNIFNYDIVEREYNLYKKEFDCGTACQYPYYFMNSEEYYHLKWKSKPIKTKFPSAKFIRENIEYAYLDNALWDLLQDKEVRELYKQTLIENYLQ